MNWQFNVIYLPLLRLYLTNLHQGKDGRLTELNVIPVWRAPVARVQ